MAHSEIELEAVGVEIITNGLSLGSRIFQQGGFAADLTVVVGDFFKNGRGGDTAAADVGQAAG